MIIEINSTVNFVYVLLNNACIFCAILSYFPVIFLLSIVVFIVERSKIIFNIDQPFFELIWTYLLNQ